MAPDVDANSASMPPMASPLVRSDVPSVTPSPIPQSPVQGAESPSAIPQFSAAGSSALTADMLLKAVSEGDAATYGTATDTMVHAMGQMATLQAQYASAAGSGDAAEAQRLGEIHGGVESQLVGLMVAVVQTTSMADRGVIASPERLAGIRSTVADVQERLGNAHSVYGSAPTSSLERVSAALQQAPVSTAEVAGMGDLWKTLSDIAANNGTVVGQTMEAELAAAVESVLYGADEKLKQEASKKQAKSDADKQEKAHEAAMSKKQAEALDMSRHRDRIRKQDDMLELQRFELFEDREVARTSHVAELQMTDVAAEMHDEQLELSRAYAEGDDIDVTRLRHDDPLPPKPRQIT